jgi:hypothetical protein
MRTMRASSFILLTVAAVLALLFAAGCTGTFGEGEVVLDDGTVLSADEAQRLEALRPKAEAAVASITGSVRAVATADGSNAASVSDQEWEAIEAEFARIIADEFGADYRKFPIVSNVADSGGASAREVKRSTNLLIGNDGRFNFFYQLAVSQHRWPWCARHHIAGDLTTRDTWDLGERPSGYVTSNKITVWDQVTSGKSTASDSTTYPWFNITVTAYGNYKWGFFPKMPSAQVRANVVWPAIPGGQWSSGILTFSF